MRGHAPGVDTADILTRVLRAEFPELDPDRLRAAVDRAMARVASASLDTEGYKVVDLHLARVEATEEGEERAKILRELAENLEQRGDAERALVVRLSAFAELPIASDLDPLLRLARVTERWSELPLDGMSALVDISGEHSARQLKELATAWQHVGRGYYAADCLERALVIAPGDAQAHEALEVFYRSTGEWSVLIDLLGRRAVHAEDDKERAEIYREMGLLYERELGDDSAALDAYQDSDRLEPGDPVVVEALARLAIKVGLPEEDQLTALERLSNTIAEPKARAVALCRAAELAKLANWDRAQRLYERARVDDPALATAVDGLASVLRDRGHLADAITLFVNAAEREGTPLLEKARWLTEAGDFCVALGDTDWATRLYRQAREADPMNHKAGAALVELSSGAGSPLELVPILDELIRVTDDAGKLRDYLLQRSTIASQVGDMTGARKALSRAVEIEPEDIATRRELADMLFEAQQWTKARILMEELLADEDLLPPGVGVELHYRSAVCARELGDRASVENHVGITLALKPDHRPAMQLRAELGSADPDTLLALANMAPPDEKATRFAALGDRYSELGDRAAAREMYREAITYRPGDHLLLTKFLGLVTDDGDWSYSLDVIQKLIDTEKEPKVRARYRHLAGQIAYGELEDPDQAASLLDQALEDDPTALPVADELEALLAAQPDKEPLVKLYYRRLEHVRAEEGRAGERLRLWDRLGDLLLELGHKDDALVAFEVALSLAPDDHARRVKLADLYAGASSKHDAAAIAHHQAVLRADKRRVASYQALRQLYQRSHQLLKARAIEDALAVIAVRPIEDRIDSLFEPSTSGELPATRREIAQRTLAPEDWLALARLDVDLQVSGLFAVVAPPFAVERARMRPPAAVPPKEHELPASIGKVLTAVIAALGSTRPPVYFDKDQGAPCKVTMRLREGTFVPVLVMGKPVIDRQLDDQELAFQLVRQLADLRAERIARLLCPRAGELAQIIELAAAQPGDTTSHAARWLAQSLHPVELEQARAIGGRLRERGVHPMGTAVAWLQATDHAADRIGFVVAGDLAKCARILERENGSPGDTSRVTQLVWSSITEEVLGVRARVEGWPATAAQAS